MPNLFLVTFITTCRHLLFELQQDRYWHAGYSISIIPDVYSGTDCFNIIVNRYKSVVLEMIACEGIVVLWKGSWSLSEVNGDDVEYGYASGTEIGSTLTFKIKKMVPGKGKKILFITVLFDDWLFWGDQHSKRWQNPANQCRLDFLCIDLCWKVDRPVISLRSSLLYFLTFFKKITTNVSFNSRKRWTFEMNPTTYERRVMLCIDDSGIWYYNTDLFKKIREV